MLIKGKDLTATQAQIVLERFQNRCTLERAKSIGDCPACAAVAPFPYICGEALPNGPIEHTRESWHAHHTPLVSDAEWLKAYAFHFTQDGSRLMENRKYAEPVYKAK